MYFHVVESELIGSVKRLTKKVRINKIEPNNIATNEGSQVHCVKGTRVRT